MRWLLLIIPFLSSLTNYGQSQVWVDSGAVWTFDVSGLGAYVYKYEYLSDTALQGQNCQVINFSRGYVNNGAMYPYSFVRNYYTYVSGDTVFYAKEDTFYVLYDFGASIGDSWIVSIDEGYECDDTSRVFVVDTGTITIANQQLRYIDIEYGSNSTYGFLGRYVERFGVNGTSPHNFQYLFPGLVQCDSLEGIYEWYRFKLKCFSDSTFSYNPTLEPCEYPLVGLSETQNKSFTLWPNPTKDILNLEVQETEPAEVMLFNQLGKLVYNQKISQVKQVQIDVSALANGIYFLHIIEESSKTNAKVLVAH